MNDLNTFKLDPNTFEQVIKSMNLKALFYSTVLNKVQEETNNEELGKWLREYATTHKESSSQSNDSNS